jgi:oligopeptide transport system ATP-binding protein
MEMNTQITHRVSYEGEPILQIQSLTKTFVLNKSLIRRMIGIKPNYLRAVHNVNLDIYSGECLGLVGESGCGKTTLGRCILRLYEPDSGQVLYKGKDFLKMKGNEVLQMRRSLQVVFQDPYSSLNPREIIEDIVGEPSLVHKISIKKEIIDRVAYLLSMVGLNPEIMLRYPHELSGGQRQRVGLARALSVNPKLIIADEPVSALDVSIQAQVINLLLDLQEKLNLTMLFITHDLRLVKYVSHRIAVMYLGNIVEIGTSKAIFSEPFHPYTRALLNAAPNINPRMRKATEPIKGEPQSPINMGNGCPFYTRCEISQSICLEQEPLLREIRPGHKVACYFA